jgi:hypothetical protein
MVIQAIFYELGDEGTPVRWSLCYDATVVLQVFCECWPEVRIVDLIGRERGSQQVDSVSIG